jgi:hypothetical protein
MIAPMCQKTDDGAEVIRRLASRFATNTDLALSKQSTELSRVELKARCLSSVGEILKSENASSDTHKQVACIFDEVFADAICSLYLAAQGLDKPAQILLRRVLDLGVAAIYLWDRPDMFWGWKECDADLSFSEMTDHLSSLPYLRFVAAENGRSDSAPIFDVTLARKEYRALSNTVHGKVTTFETALADRFQHSDTDWEAHIRRIESVQNLILDLAKARFAIVRDKLPIAQPQLNALK